MAREKIMIVEDENIVAESLHDKLESLGYEVVAMADSGEEALEKAQASHPDLILMDIMLKGEMDGIETAGLIKTQLETPVVFLTAYSDENTLQRAKIKEPFGYIIKPFKERELHSNIEISLYKHRMDQQVKENERRLSSILANIGDAVITLDLQKNIVYLSPVAQTLMGTEALTMIGKPVASCLNIQCVSNPEVLTTLIEKAAHGETCYCLVEQDAVLKRTAAPDIFVDLGVAPIQDNQQISGVILALRDITERRKTELMLLEAQEFILNSLTSREKEVLQYMVDGLTTKEIAYDLHISTRTVEAHRKNMMQKLKVHDMTGLVRFAITHRLVRVTA